MENQKNQLFLPIPLPSKKRLTFCEATPKGLVRWMQALPKANIGEMSRQIYSALNELNELITPPDNRLQLLDLLRKEVFSICGILDIELLSHRLLLDKRLQQISALYQSLQIRLAVGYKLIVIQCLQSLDSKRLSSKNSDLVGTALQRTCYSLRTLFLHACQRYSPPAYGLWLEIHRMYQLACKVGLQNIPITDTQSVSGELSCEQTWLCTVLLGCVRTNQIHQEGIATVLHAFEYWGDHVKLQTAHDKSALFVVDLSRDAPPRYRSMQENWRYSSQLGLDLSELVRAIERQLMAEELPLGLTAELLCHLLADFSAPFERRAQRESAQEELTLCLGMSALHYFLAGERPFAKLLGNGGGVEGSLSTMQEQAPTSWSGSVGSTERLLNASGDISFAQNTKAETYLEKSELYPLYVGKLLNRSVGGYCIHWGEGHNAQPQIGELVGIREQGKNDWNVVQVRWIFQDGTTVRLGIERIADTAQPCGLQSLRHSSGKASLFFRALLLESAKGTQPQLLAPSLPFQQGDKVCINVEGEERLAVLERRVSGSVNFNLFAYSLLEGKNQESAPSAAGNRASPAARPSDEHFDTLWDTL